MNYLQYSSDQLKTADAKAQVRVSTTEFGFRPCECRPSVSGFSQDTDRECAPGGDWAVSCRSGMAKAGGILDSDPTGLLGALPRLRTDLARPDSSVDDGSYDSLSKFPAKDEIGKTLPEDVRTLSRVQVQRCWTRSRVGEVRVAIWWTDAYAFAERNRQGETPVQIDAVVLEHLFYEASTAFVLRRSRTLRLTKWPRLVVITVIRVLRAQMFRLRRGYFAIRRRGFAIKAAIRRCTWRTKSLVSVWLNSWGNFTKLTKLAAQHSTGRFSQRSTVGYDRIRIRRLVAVVDTAPRPVRQVTPVNRSTTQTLTGIGLERFAVVRILGNDLPPRHSGEQTIRNLKWLLNHEQLDPDFQRSWVVNRIVNEAVRSEVVEILNAWDENWIDIPFVPEEFSNVPYDFNEELPEELIFSPAFAELPRTQRVQLLNRVYLKKNCYAINNNGARNRALDVGFEFATRVIPGDGSIYLSKRSQFEIRSSVASSIACPYHIIPMYRTTNFLGLEELPGDGATPEEPQVCFARNSELRFDPNIPYGRRPKVSLLWALGVPGPWTRYEIRAWDLTPPVLHRQAGAFAYAGYVRRLPSGDGRQEVGRHASSSRMQSRNVGTLRFLANTELQCGVESSLTSFVLQHI